jgi:hypothetical protein
MAQRKKGKKLTTEQAVEQLLGHTAQAHPPGRRTACSRGRRKARRDEEEEVITGALPLSDRVTHGAAHCITLFAPCGRPPLLAQMRPVLRCSRQLCLLLHASSLVTHPSVPSCP